MVQQHRRQAIQGLQANAERQCAKTLAHCRAIQNSVSDVRFTSRYRVPFPYSRQLLDCFLLGSMADETRGSQVRDLDGNWCYDLSGSYGVNVFGYDFYKQCMDEGIAQTKALGPVLGTYHPLIVENVNIIRQVSGLDEVSFHMSGTEAVVQAVRLARYHTGKTLGGGLPIGVLAGTQKLMQRFKANQPVNVSFARGTFNSHPCVMGAMNVFLNRIGQSDIQQQYLESESLWNTRVARFNQRLESEGLPLRITNIHSILSVLYTLPGRYNWMFQFYLRQASLTSTAATSGLICACLKNWR